MRQSGRRAIIGLTLSMLVCAFGSALVDAQTVDIERLSDRIIVANVQLIGRNNVVAVSTKKGLVLIDTGSSPFVAGLLKQEIEKQLGRTDWIFVVNTHAHDHVGGNAVFKHVPIIGHENIIGEMKTQWIDFMASEEKRASRVRFVQEKVLQLQKHLDDGAPDSETLRSQIAFWRELEREVAAGYEAVIPTMTFSEDLALDMGDVTVRAMYFGRGHSLSDVIVYVPEEKVLVAGGVCYPFFPTIKDGVRLVDLKRSILVLDRVLDAGVERVVAAHAEVFGRPVVERLRDYYRDLLAGVAAARGQGLMLEKAQAQLGLDRRFPYMRAAQARRGRIEDAHAANVAAVWKLAAQ